MTELPIIIISSIIITGILNYLITYLSTPKEREILFFLNHGSRKMINNHYDLWITVISFFTIATLSFLVYKYLGIKEKFETDPSTLIIVSSILIFINFCFSFIIIGRLKTSSLSHGFKSNLIRLILMLMWIIATTLMMGAFPFSLATDSDYTIILLKLQLYYNLIVSITLGLVIFWRVKIIDNQKLMTEEINTFIDSHGLYIMALQIIRSELIKKHNPINDKRREIEAMKGLLLEKITIKMRDENFQEDYFNTSAIHNFFWFGVWSKIPLCAIACTNKLLSVIKKELITFDSEKLLMKLQHLTHTGNLADIGVNCPKTSENIRVCCNIDKYYYKRINDQKKELFVKLNVLKCNGEIRESVTIDHKNLLWVQL